MRRIVTIAAAAAAMVVWSASLASAATGWAIQATPNPAGSTAAVLSGVSCVSAASCTAVGYADVSSGRVTLAEHWNGHTWAIQATPNPTGSTLASLQDVSCASATSCTAVGSYSPTEQSVTLAEYWNGTSWAIQTTPNPTPSYGAILSAVSCISATSCTAIGTYQQPSPPQEKTLAEYWNGSTWAIQKSPTPSGDTTLTGISCVSAASCIATGSHNPFNNGSLPVAERWNGSTWAIQKTVIPGGGTDLQLAGVSCVSAANCTAAGFYTTSSGQTVPLIERWNGSRWAIQDTPTPSGTPAWLWGVSCVSAANCTAAGSTSTLTGRVPMAEHWNGHTWAIQATPNPTGSTDAILIGVSCAPATTRCTAAGWANAGQVTLAEHK